MATTVARLEAVLTANTRDFDRAMDKSEGRSRGFSSGVTKAALVAGAGVVFGLGKAVNAAAGFEQSLNTLQAVTGVTGGELDSLRKEAIKLGADTKLPATSAADAALAMTELSKAGLTVKDTMAATRPVLLLSAAAGIDNARAAEITANALNAFSLKGKQAALVADQLANTANASSVEITDVADSFKMAAAVFAGFQAPAIGAKNAMTELNVAIGILGNMGIKGSDAGTSLKQMLLQLTGPTAKAQALMEALMVSTKGAGISEQMLIAIMQGTKKERDKALDQLGKMNPGMEDLGNIAYTAAGKMRPLKDIIRLTSEATKHMTGEQRNMVITQIFGADATRSVIALMKSGVPAWDKMTKAVQKRGAAEDLAAAKMKGFKGTMEAGKSAIETLEITIGTGLLPIMTTLAGTLAIVANAAAAHTTTTKLLIGATAAFAAIVLTTNTYMKIMASTFVVKVIPALIKTTAVQWLLNAATAAFPVIAIIAGLVAVGIAIYVFRDKIMNAFGWIKDHWPLLLAILVGPIGLAVLGIIQHRDRILAIFSNLPGQIGYVFTAGIGAVKNAIVGLFGKVIGWVKDVLGIGSPSKVFHEIGQHVVTGFINGVGSMAGVLKNAVFSMVKKFLPDFSQPGLPPGQGGRFGPGAGGRGERGRDTQVGANVLASQVPGHDRVAAVVDAAVGYAYEHGWRGRVTSAWRSYGEQSALYQRYLHGGPLAARPGTSSHESGHAVDVTDYGTFGRIMSSAPGWARLFNRLGSRDPVHFSVSGYDKGGWLPTGLSLALNNTGRPERVIPPGGGGDTIILQVGTDEVARIVFDQVRGKARVFRRNNGRPAFGGA